MNLGDTNDKITTDIITERELDSVSENLSKKEANVTEKRPLIYSKDNTETTKVVNNNEIVKSSRKMATRNKRIDYCSLSSDKQTTNSFKTKKRKVSSVGTISEHTKKLKPVSNRKKSNHEDSMSNNCKIVENQRESFDDSLVMEQNFCKDEDQATCHKNGSVEFKDKRTEHSDNSEKGEQKCMIDNVQSDICLSKKNINSNLVKAHLHEESNADLR